MGQADQALAYAEAQIGKPYVFGTQGPNTFDCSGLVKAAYDHVTPPVHLVHYTGTMILEGIEVSRSDLQIGDLVFPNIDHVQLYAGDGQVIEAPHAGAVVRKVPIYSFWRARRVATDGDTPTGKLADIILPNGMRIPAPGPDAQINSDGSISFPGLQGASNAIAASGKIFGTLTNPHFWLRAGAIATGMMVILIGIIIAFRKQEIAAARNTVATAKSAIGLAGGAAVSRVASERAAASRLATKRPRGAGYAQGSTEHLKGPATGRPYSGRHRGEP